MRVPLWTRSSVLAAGLLVGSGAWAATSYDLLVNHDAFQRVGDFDTPAATVVDGPVGGTFVYRAKSKINGAAGLVNNAVLTQKLPADAIFQSITAPTGVTCANVPSVGQPVGTSIITCTYPSLTEVEQHVDFEVVLPTESTGHEAYASLTAPGNTDVNSGNDQNIPRNITTYKRADLAVSFLSPVDGSTHQQGSLVDYDIQVRNTDSEYAFELKAGEKAVVRISQPEGTAFTGPPTSQDDKWACSAGTDNSATPPVPVYDCTYIAPVGGVAKDTDLPWLKVPVLIEADDGGTDALVSVAGQTQAGVHFYDAYPDNNSDKISINFTPNTQMDMTLAKSVSPAVVDYKATGPVDVVYTLAATRVSGGMMPELPIRITDELPDHVAYQGDVTGSGWSCSAIGKTVTCDLTQADAISSNGNLPALTFKASVDVAAVTLTDGKDVLKNEALLTVANEPAANKTNNNTARADLTVSNNIDLSTSKESSVPLIAQDQEFVYTIAVRNNGPLDAQENQTITVVDVLDPQLEYVADAAAEAPWVCTATNTPWSAGNAQTVTCSLNEGIAANTNKNLTIKTKAHLSGGAKWAKIGNQASVSCPTGRVCIGWTDDKILTNAYEINVSEVYADLSITKEAAITPDSSSYAADASGAEVVYTLKVKNAVPNPLPAGYQASDFQTAKTVEVTDTIINLLNNNVWPDPHPVTGTPRYDNNRFVEASYGFDVTSLPAGMSVDACTYQSSGNHTTKVTCILRNVPVSNDEYSITIKARQFVNPKSSAEQTNSITNTAEVVSSDTAELDVDNNKDEATVELSALTNMTTQKQASFDDDLSPAAAGQKIEYTLSAINQGPSQATGVQVVDTLPLGMIWVTEPSFTGGANPRNCSLSNGETIAPGLVVTAANQTMTCTWGTAFNGGIGSTNRTVKYALRSSTTDYPASVTNSVVVSTTTPETKNDDNETSKVVKLDTPKLDVLINMGHDKDGLPINEGNASKTQYTITVSNSGASTSYATNVRMFDRFPAEGSTAEFQSVDVNVDSVMLQGSGQQRFSTSDCAFVTTEPTGLSCEFDWLAPGETVDIMFTMLATGIDNDGLPVGTILHEATVEADAEDLGLSGEVDADGNPIPVDVDANNTVTDRTSTYDGELVDNPDDLRFVDLSIKKESSITGDEVEVGDEILYRLTVTNEEPKNDLIDGNAIVTDTLPAGLVLVGSVPAGCSYTAPTLECVVTDLAAGASTTFEFTTEVEKLAYGQKIIANTATVSSYGDSNPKNNEDEEEVPSVPPLAPTPVPVDNPLALLALILGMGWIARRFHMRKHA